MTLRVVQISLPRERRESVQQAVRDAAPLDTWSHELEDDRVLISVVVETQASEALLDSVQHVLDPAGRDYRIVVLPVEGSLPHKPPDEPTPEGAKVAQTIRDRVSRAELLNDLAEGLAPTPRYFVMVLLSSVVAAVGLLRNDIAIVIGAMVIAPLLTPNVALALATTLGDLDMMRRALRTNLYGITTALSFAFAIGMVTDLDPEIPSIASRSIVTFADVVLALAAGAAGALAFTTGLPASLVGVMVAVALLPPAVVTGMLVGSSHFQLAAGSLHLLSVNVISVNLSGVLTFWIQGLRPRSWWMAEKARRSTRIAVTLWSLSLAALAALVYFSDEL